MKENSKHPTAPRHIVELTIENFMRVEAVHITPEGHLVELSGKNDSGKTSVIDAIWAALGGASAIPAIPLRKGAKNGLITLDLGDIAVTRTFTQDGNSYLAVTDTAKNTPIRSPQAVLDGLLKTKTCAPQTLLALKPKDFLVELFNLLGIDPTAIDNEYDKVFQERTVVNRLAAEKKAALANAGAWDAAAPDEETSISELLEELENVRENNRKRSGADDLVRQWRDAVADLESQLKAAKEELETAKRYAAKQPKTAVTFDLEEGIRHSERVNERVRANQARASLRSDYEKALAASAKLTERLQELKEERADLLNSADLPIKGLTFDDDNNLLYKGLPWAQAAYSDRLGIATTLILAAQPDLRIVRLDNGSEIGKERLEGLKKVAARYDAQIWLARVVDDPSQVKSGVIIEDGHSRQAQSGKLQP